MSYEEFLQLQVTQVTQFAQILSFKRKNQIPFSEEEEMIQEHLIRYNEQLELQEEKARLEYFYSLKSYNKNQK